MDVKITLTETRSISVKKRDVASVMVSYLSAQPIWLQESFHIFSVVTSRDEDYTERFIFFFFYDTERNCDWITNTFILFLVIHDIDIISEFLDKTDTENDRHKDVKR